MKKVQRLILIGFVVVASFLFLSACKETGQSKDSTESLLGDQITGQSGAVLYANYCEGCHSSLYASNKGQRNAEAIVYSIEINSGNAEEGYMGALTALIDKSDSNSPIHRIATLLGNVSLREPEGVSGQVLYKSYCSGCHNELSDSNKAGRSKEAILYSNLVADEMAHLTALSSTALTNIGAVLEAVTITDIPSTGLGWYNNFCKGCHFDLANSNVRKASASTIKAKFSVREMNFLQSTNLPQLTDEEIDKIAAVLAP